MEFLGELATEKVNQNTANIDQLDIKGILKKINEEDQKPALAVKEVIPEIKKAVEKMKERWNRDGRIIYVGAGTSGRLGVLDAAESTPTFGIDPERMIGIIAGGKNGMFQTTKDIEDSYEQGYQDLKTIDLKKEDIVIGITASGRTPYVFGAFSHCNEIGALKIALACNREAKIKEEADVAILPEPGPEPILGSTRMKAGTAQKMVLNMISTTLMIISGKVYKNLMVDVQQVNEKLRDRAIRIVNIACGIEKSEAKKILKQADGKVKVAILINAGFSKKEAEKKLKIHSGSIRSVIEAT